MGGRRHARRRRRGGEGAQQPPCGDRHRQAAGIDLGKRVVELRANVGVGAKRVAEAGVDAFPEPRACLAAASLLQGAALPTLTNDVRAGRVAASVAARRLIDLMH